ncbi:unnamed protein product [Phytophthora lilii]|uniref:Unnamed protein product n=1 Tax=Phytophthora lilii TaxID=2077276 RepID=A0A9W6WUT5_9STRA|nr:unnamed protein product [Phytophthora lilii]
MLYVSQTDTHTGWAFVDPVATPSLTGPTGHGSYTSKDCTPDTVNNARFIRDLYEKFTPDKTAFSVPLLWDKKKSTIVSNDSAEIVRMFNSAFEDLVPSKLDLYPKCGFAGTQELYDAAVDNVFAGLDRAEKILSEHRYLVGDRLTETDLKLFPTLVRFDEVYAVHFKANKKLIAQYPNLSNVRALQRYNNFPT